MALDQIAVTRIDTMSAGVKAMVPFDDTRFGSCCIL